MYLRSLTVLAVCALTATAPRPVSAQDIGDLPVPLVEVSGGYMFMRDFSDEDELGVGDVDFPAGWYFSAAVNPTQWLGLVGEVGGSYKNDFEAGPPGFSVSNTARVYTFLGGPRFFHKAGRVVPFVQVLAGVAHMRLKTVFPTEIYAPGTFKADTTAFAIQPGAGLTVLLTETVGVRVSGDYRSIMDFAGEEETIYMNEFRLAAGFTLHWGGR